MAASDNERLQGIHENLDSLIRDWVTVLSERDQSEETFTDILGSLQAMKELARRIVGVESRLRRLEGLKDQLRAKLAEGGRPDANRVKERIDAVQGQIGRLDGIRAGLVENLSNLSSLLRGGES